ncbi:hypothetical protein TSUD_238600 [Trifolium subterraneum]|uniref:SHSP domain-containing protein n=1 Tax=Trifolium subterraneum TaxID=3900 RepID=A0A2Z6NTZ5_TRISU|nr:hypothetical protein TSUD_238600 [Trifolium subterraneum]
MPPQNDDDSLHVRLYVPGLLKEDVEICVDHNTLTLTIKDTNETKQGLRFSAIYDLTAHINDDGELNIVVPKINKKEEKNQERNQEGVKINVNVE